MNNTEILNKWELAFDDEQFQKQLQKYRDDIELLIREFIQRVKKSEQQIMMFDSIESRIKSTESFVQKMSRKNYVHTWKLSECKTENQQFILNNLSDLIGFRITCYFIDDEKKIYDLLISDEIKDVVLDKNTNKTQKNQHIIYKMEGTYKRECKFEIQIKSLVNNFWGEVEHRTIYKSRSFDCNKDDRKAINDGTYDILTATDKQLNSLFNLDYGKDKMIEGLYYEMTQKRISELFSTDILGKAYYQFFSIFYKNYNHIIINYVGKKLLGDNVKPTIAPSNYDQEYVVSIKTKLLESFYEYDFLLVKAISEMCFSYSKENDFYNLFISSLIPKETLGFFDDTEPFSEEVDPDVSQDTVNDDYKVIYEILKTLDFSEGKKNEHI